MNIFNKLLLGSRPKTWPNAIAPVLVGWGASYAVPGFTCPLVNFMLALILSLLLVITVNFANDYADGIKGTDGETRIGAPRLVGSGLASPRFVKITALCTTLISVFLGLTLCWRVKSWILLLIGIACVGLVWLYTSGPIPLAYNALGEITVFIVFGPVAVLGTEFSCAHAINFMGILGALSMGGFSAAVMTTNNLRDIYTDAQYNKKTLAVKLGEQATRILYLCLMMLPFICAIIAAWHIPEFFTEIMALIPAYYAIKIIIKKAQGKALLTALSWTGITMLVWAVIFLGVMWKTYVPA